MILAKLFPQNVLSPGGSLLADSQRGPIVFTYVLFGVGRGTECSSKTYRVYPPKGVCFADSHRGPIVFTLHFIGVGRGTQDSKSYWVYRIFFLRKCFIPRRDSAKQIPKELQLFLLMSYFGLGNVYWTFNLLAFFCLFETPRMFYPPKGLCKADTEGGLIVFTYVLFWVSKRILDFQFTDGFLPF